MQAPAKSLQCEHVRLGGKPRDSCLHLEALVLRLDRGVSLSVLHIPLLIIISSSSTTCCVVQITTRVATDNQIAKVPNMILFSSLAAALALVSSVAAQCGSGTPDATVTVRVHTSILIHLTEIY
jgi:hypothetical protein